MPSRRSKRASTPSAAGADGRVSCNEDAFEVLRKAGCPVKGVYRVEPDRVLWVDRFDKARTALIQARKKDEVWLCRVVTTYEGWPVE